MADHSSSAAVVEREAIGMNTTKATGTAAARHVGGSSVHDGGSSPPRAAWRCMRPEITDSAAMFTAYTAIAAGWSA